MSKRCGVFPSYQTDLSGRCVRYIACAASEHTKNPKCPAKGQKQGACMELDAGQGPCCRSLGCTWCCRENRMALTRGDVKRIRRLGYRDRDFLSVAKGERYLLNHGGACVFLGDEGCRIYPHRPMGCRLYPLVYDPGTRRSVLDSECPHRGEFRIREDDVRRLRGLVRAIKRERRKELVE